MENTREIYPVMMDNEANRVLLQKKDICDKYDYITAVACGAIGGMIDIFLVGSSENSILGNWTDQQVDKIVMAFAEKMGWDPREQNVNNAIQFLEKRFTVNYDQRTSSDVNGIFNMATRTHHMMSLAHSPDLIGLFFSILNQFTSTASFIVDGQIITVATDTFELQGGNFVMKIMCGIANWFGHLMSDIAGSHGAKSRGTGIVMPFYELFGFCKFGNFNIGGDERKNLAEIAQIAFSTNGYDFRFGLTQTIPIVVTELSIRLIWALRRRFQYHKPIKECIPCTKYADLRIMLLLGNGTLCIMDGIDAGVRSGGNFLLFFMRMNLCAWFRFAILVLKEVCIRIGLSGSMQEQIDAYKRITEALNSYLEELKRINIALYEKETCEYNKIVNTFTSITSEKELNAILLNSYEELGIKKAWKGEFDEHMSNKKGKLVFE